MDAELIGCKVAVIISLSLGVFILGLMKFAEVLAGEGFGRSTSGIVPAPPGKREVPFSVLNRLRRIVLRG